MSSTIARRFVNLKACFYQTLADAVEHDLIDGLVNTGGRQTESEFHSLFDRAGFELTRIVPATSGASFPVRYRSMDYIDFREIKCHE